MFQPIKIARAHKHTQMRTHRGALSHVAQSHSNESALVSPVAFQITTLNTQHVWNARTHARTHVGLSIFVRNLIDIM